MQLARIIFLNNLEAMKRILDLIAFKTNKTSDDYKYYKKEIMSTTYKNLNKIFKQLEENKIAKKCECKANFKQGYKDCPKCGGSGFRNV